MKQVHISLDSALRDIFAFEEAKAVFLAIVDRGAIGLKAALAGTPYV